jgi:hypothetical protein
MTSILYLSVADFFLFAGHHVIIHSKSLPFYMLCSPPSSRIPRQPSYPIEYPLSVRLKSESPFARLTPRDVIILWTNVSQHNHPHFLAIEIMIVRLHDMYFLWSAEYNTVRTALRTVLL